jgi:membrane protein required for beta-lactamase induction
MKRIKLFFDILDYILVRLFLLVLLLVGAITLVMQHWPLHR